MGIVGMGVDRVRQRRQSPASRGRDHRASESRNPPWRWERAAAGSCSSCDRELAAGDSAGGMGRGETRVASWGVAAPLAFRERRQDSHRCRLAGRPVSCHARGWPRSPECCSAGAGVAESPRRPISPTLQSEAPGAGADARLAGRLVVLRRWRCRSALIAAGLFIRTLAQPGHGTRAGFDTRTSCRNRDPGEKDTRWFRAKAVLKR